MSQIQVPDEWKSDVLENICLKITDRDHITPKYVTEGIPIISPKDFKGYSIDFSDCKYISKEDHAKNSLRTDLQKGDILFSRIGTIGKVILHNYDKEFSILHSIVMIRPNNSVINKKYLYYFLQSSFIQKQSRKDVQSVGTPDLGINKIRRFPIFFPKDLKMQEKIAKRLDYILGQLDEKKNEVLKLQDPSRIKKLQNSIKYQLLFSLRNGSLANKDWTKYERKRLGKIMHFTSGGTPLRTVSEYWNGDIPWIKSGELLDGDIDDSEEHITKQGLEHSSAKIFPADTILVALYGQGQTRGRTGRLLRESSTNQACCAILPEQSIYSRYLQYWIRGLYWELRETASGGAQPNWNSTTLKNIEIVIPPISVQKSLVCRLDEKFNEAKFIEDKILKVSQRKDFSEYFNSISSRILTEAFSGKLVD